MSKKNIFFIVYLCSVTFLFGTVVIDKPGNYKIAKNVTVATNTPNNPAILISSSNVNLDFQNYILSLSTDNTALNIDGITVNNDLSNITIRNITIQNVSGVGIHVLDGCSNINLLNSTIQGCHAAGVFLEGSASGTGIKSCVIHNCQVSSCTGVEGGVAYGIRCENASLGQISNSHVALNDSGITNSAYGIYIENTKAFEVASTTIVGNGGTNLVAGLAIVQSFTGIINEITMYKNTARSSGTVCGILLDQSQDIFVSNCKSNANTHNEATAIGFLSQNGQRNVFKDCVAELNTGGTYAAGIRFIGEQNSRVMNCLLQDQKTLSSGTAHGIVFSSNCDLCWATENKIINNLGESSSFGIRDERSSSTSIIIRNYAFNNGTNYSVTYPLTITLPIISVSLSNALVGITSGVAGVLDNIDITP
jgi:parallel beta-helix repeat protein